MKVSKLKKKKIALYLLIIYALWASLYLFTTQNKKAVFKDIIYEYNKKTNEYNEFVSEVLPIYEEKLSKLSKEDFENANKKPVSTENTKFCIVIPSYNNVKYVPQNLNSVFRQDYHNWRIVYIDDASDDGTNALVKMIKKNSGLSNNRFTLVRHKTRMRSVAYSFYEAAHNYCADEEVMVHLDGDDMLATSHILSKLANEYSNGKTWITYGQFIKLHDGQTAERGNNEISANNWTNMRTLPWSTSQLRTSYTWLFKKINVNDLMYKDEFIRAGGDVAFMYPMLEMAGKDRTKFIRDITYIYRIHNSNDRVLYSEESKRMANYIRNKPRYKCLD